MLRVSSSDAGGLTCCPHRVSLLLLFSQLCHPTGSLWKSHSLPWLCSHRRDEAPVGTLRVLVVPGEQQGWSQAGGRRMGGCCPPEPPCLSPGTTECPPRDLQMLKC